MDKITLQKIDPSRAAALLAASGMADPAGMTTPETLAAGGECFSLSDGVSDGVFVIKRRGEKMWISGAGAVQSRGLTAPGLGVIEAIAKQSGCARVGFQTGRPGLVRLAKKQGYRVAGFILEKGI